MSKSKIKILSQDIINKISAGESIDRPYTVIKELIENSIDSKASNIEIKIQNGGKNLITVSDNGCGISKEDLSLAIKRHATSKLDDDIYNVLYLGFRGEALASICDIANVQISSKSEKSDSGYKLSSDLISGVQEIEKIPYDDIGTTINITHLFGSIPNKLKFLQSDTIETNAIIKLIQNIAIVNHNISFSFYSNGKQVLNYKYLDQQDRKNYEIISLKHRLKEVIGENFLVNSEYFDYSENNFRIFGYASFPTHQLTQNKVRIISAVNNRFVQDPFISQCIKACYLNLSDVQHKQSVVLFIEIINSMLDVNVHPHKNEVRFSNEREIKNAIIRTIRKAISKSPTSDIFSNNMIEKFSSQGNNNLEKTYENNLVYVDKEELMSHTTNINYNDFEDILSIYKIDNKINSKSTNIVQPNNSEYGISKEKIDSKNDKCDSIVYFQNSYLQNKNTFNLGKPLAQIGDLYIISIFEDKLFIIDQHAAHERIILESIKKSMFNNKIVTQSFLYPIELNVDEGFAQLVETFANIISNIGIILKRKDKNTIEILSMPPIFKEHQTSYNEFQIIENLILEFSEKHYLAEELTQETIIKIYSDIACHKSILRGKKLTIEEMNYILRKMEETEFSSQCNHGRPTFVNIKSEDIDKIFKR